MCQSSGSQELEFEEVLIDHGWVKHIITGLYSHEALGYPNVVSQNHAVLVHKEMIDFMRNGYHDRLQH